MGTKIHYSSGSSVELRDGEGDRFWNRARTAGFRYYQSLDNVVIPFNHPTITYIELELTKPAVGPSFEKPKEEITITEAKEIEETNRAKQEREFMAKANCTHKNPDGSTKRSMYYVDTVNGRKYFPVCDFCGHRERYVGVPKVEKGDHPLWHMDDIRNAKPYKG